MRYSDAITRAFRALKSGGLWGFAATASVALLAVVAIPVLAAYFVLGPVLSGLFNGTSVGTGGGLVGAGQAVAASIGFLVGLVLAIPLGLTYHGGLVHLSDEAIAGREARLGDGWSFGARRMGRTFAVDFVVGFTLFLVTLVAMVPFIVAAALLIPASGNSTGGAVGAVVGICGGYLFLFLVILAAGVVIMGWAALAIRYALIGGRTSGDALSSGWRAWRARWKSVVVFALIAIGLQYAYSFVSSIVIVPAELVLMPHAFFPAGQDPSAAVPELLRGYAVILPLSIALYLPWTVYLQNLWTAFFRQMTGLDVPPQPAPVAYDPYVPSQTAPPQPPAPPAEEPPRA